jgi:hypothetical protein
VQTEEQFRAVLSSDDVDLIYVPYGFFCNTDADDGQLFAKAESLLKDARARGKKLSLAMPYIERNDGIAQIRTIDNRSLKSGMRDFWRGVSRRLQGLEKRDLKSLRGRTAPFIRSTVKQGSFLNPSALIKIRCRLS